MGITPLFSVIVPVKDRFALLARALASLEHQTLKDFEVLIVDDGSIGDVQKVLDQFVKLEPKLISTGGANANVARNLGVKGAAGRYIAFLDSDDLFLPEKLAKSAQRILDTKPEIIVTKAFVWRGPGPLQVRPHRFPNAGEDISDYIFASGLRIQTSTIILRADIGQVVQWDESLRKLQDPDYLLRLIRAGYRLETMNEALVILDDAPSGRISNTTWEAGLLKWLENAGPLLTTRARRGFMIYVLAYDVAAYSRLKAVKIIIKNSNWESRIQSFKSLSRILIPRKVFRMGAKALAFLKSGKEASYATNCISAMSMKSTIARSDSTAISQIDHLQMPRNPYHVVVTKYNVAHIDYISDVRLNEVWLQQRLALFKAWPFPSLKNQTRPPERWLILVDVATPQSHLRALGILTDRIATLVAVSKPLSDKEIGEVISPYIDPNTSILITTRLDSDDAIAATYLERVYNNAVIWRGFINAPWGYVTDYNWMLRVRNSSGPFLSFVEEYNGGAPTTVYQGTHTLVFQRAPLMQLSGPPAWLQVIHGGNIANTLFGLPSTWSRAASDIGSDVLGFRSRRQSFTPQHLLYALYKQLLHELHYLIIRWRWHR